MVKSKIVDSKGGRHFVFRAKSYAKKFLIVSLVFRICYILLNHLLSIPICGNHRNDFFLRASIISSEFPS